MGNLQDRQEEDNKGTRKKRTRKQEWKRPLCGRHKWILPALILLMIVMAAGILLTRSRGKEENRMEQDAVPGQMPGVDHNKIQAQTGETQILFSINTNQVFDSDTGAGSILFENPAENQKLVQLQICRWDTGESIYESGLIKPGYYIDAEKLDTVPEPGDYPCKAYVYGYRMDNHEYIGKVETNIIVSVQPSLNQS